MKIQSYVCSVTPWLVACVEASAQTASTERLFWHHDVPAKKMGILHTASHVSPSNCNISGHHKLSGSIALS